MAQSGVFEVRQPLLRGFGNQVNLAPIRIAQAKQEQSRWEVEGATIAQVRSVEEAYWQLHAAHVAWQAIQSVVPIAQEAVRIEELRYRAERSTYADLARTKVQVERLIQQSAAAQLRVAQQENQLRQLIGLDVAAGPPLLPVDVPRDDAVLINVPQAIGIAVERRPDLHQRRSEVRALDWRRLTAQNETLPQLDARYQYRTNGLASRLDDAVQQAATFDYSDWTIGLELSIPLGNRQARSKLLAREREVARERARLCEYERQVAYDIAVLVAELQSRWEQAGSRRASAGGNATVAATGHHPLLQSDRRRRWPQRVAGGA